MQDFIEMQPFKVEMIQDNSTTLQNIKQQKHSENTVLQVYHLKTRVASRCSRLFKLFCGDHNHICTITICCKFCTGSLQEESGFALWPWCRIMTTIRWKRDRVFCDEFAWCISLCSFTTSSRTKAAVGAALRFLRMRRPRPASRHPVAVQDGDTGSRETGVGVRGAAAELSCRGGRRRLPQRTDVLSR